MPVIAAIVVEPASAKSVSELARTQPSIQTKTNARIAAGLARALAVVRREMESLRSAFSDS
jgi:hypothetical protein